jgi:hypothetical protein
MRGIRPASEAQSDSLCFKEDTSGLESRRRRVWTLALIFVIDGIYVAILGTCFDMLWEMKELVVLGPKYAEKAAAVIHRNLLAGQMFRGVELVAPDQLGDHRINAGIC